MVERIESKKSAPVNYNINKQNQIIMRKEQILGIIRHTLTFVGGILITRGLIDETFVTEAVGGLMTVIGLFWSIIEKSKD